MIVNFSKESLVNLSKFLDRVPLKGKNEALAMVNIMREVESSLKKEGDKND